MRIQLTGRVTVAFRVALIAALIAISPLAAQAGDKKDQPSPAVLDPNTGLPVQNGKTRSGKIRKKSCRKFPTMACRSARSRKFCGDNLTMNSTCSFPTVGRTQVIHRERLTPKLFR